MSNEDIWKEIQNSMAIEGWEISDDELARIQKKYEKSNQKEILEKVYSHKKLLVLGGDDDIGNVEATDVSVHISIHGQVHQQVKYLPDGTPISEIKIK